MDHDVRDCLAVSSASEAYYKAHAGWPSTSVELAEGSTLGHESLDISGLINLEFKTELDGSFTSQWKEKDGFSLSSVSVHLRSPPIRPGSSTVPTISN
jgi:hypothetical protein